MLPAFIDDNLRWWVSGGIIVLGLLVYGFKDLTRFSLYRAWAISSVCFAESIRRWVILIPALAIIGVIGVSQFIRGDEQDVIRQTVKYSLFATGMVVTITTILLACTNLPREIDSRVIYTVVTKPTTRLEIVVGKVVGFAKVALLILAIMGVFTFGYAWLREWNLRRAMQSRLEAGAVDPLSRATYQYWVDHGLLSSRTFQTPKQLNLYAKEPGRDPRRWFYGFGDADIAVPFLLDRAALTPEGIPGAEPGDLGIIVRLYVGFELSKFIPMIDGMIAGTPPTTRPEKAHVLIDFLDENFNSLVQAQHINKGLPIELSDPTGRTEVPVPISPEGAKELLRSPRFYVSVAGSTLGVEHFVDIAPKPMLDLYPVTIIVPGTTSRIYGPMHDRSGPTYTPSAPIFRGRGGLYGQQLRGGKPETSPIAMFEFRDAPPPRNDGDITFEFKTRIELSSAEREEDEFSRFEITVINHQTGQRTVPTAISPESNRTTYFTLPAQALAGGNFDIQIRNFGAGHYATVSAESLQMVASEETFTGNLVRSLSILWMLSILVVIVSICCSTFLSWPIAVVLTLLVLLGHWGIMQVSDSLAPGIGNQVAQEIFGVQRASEGRVVSAYVEAMSRLLNRLAGVLPDISRFSAVEDIERGVTISRAALLAPLGVLGLFGLPMLVLSYVFLRNKEVAP